jgi:hypothetical protein
MIAKRIRSDWDWFTYLTGGEGTGKSTCAIWQAHYVSGPLFDITKNICYDAEDFLRLVDDVPKYSTILLDEGGEAWYNRDFASTMNKALGKAVQQIRDRNLNVEVCVPDLDLLDSQALRRHKTWIKCTAPAFQRGYSTWHMPRWKYYPAKGQNIPHWTVLFHHRFLDLPEPYRSAYKKVKTEKSKERLAGYLDVVQRQKEKARDKSSKLSAQEVAQQIMDGDLAKYLNTRGTLDIAKIQNDFKVGRPTADRARKIVKIPA